MTDSFFPRPLRIAAVLLAFWLILPSTLLAAPFDPEAASRAYLATVNGAARAKSDAYFEGGYWLLLWGTIIAIASEIR